MKTEYLCNKYLKMAAGLLCTPPGTQTHFCKYTGKFSSAIFVLFCSFKKTEDCKHECHRFCAI